ncbi:enolase, partial [Salmonella enterica subsp. enterica serovar Weltevreden]|nr:enolase [Salmonella enterica subsp. enterica serovar Weltevreden]
QIIIDEIRSRDAFEGVGFIYTKPEGGQGIYAHAKEKADNLLCEDPNEIEKINTKLLWAAASLGRSGIEVQAISPIDIALCD